MAKLEDDVDSLFKLPLSEFIGARKTLIARLKKSGDKDEAQRVNALTKPSVSAWTVNQLYWHQRDEFDELIATGQRFRKAQTSGKVANMREALDARREALSNLSDLATEILRDAGHNPSLDTLRRITATLEALSASTTSEGPMPGRLTQDVDPPGFDSFGSFTPSPVTTKRAAEPPRPGPPKKSVAAPKESQPKTTAAVEAKRREQRQARINAAKASLQNAKKALTAAQAQAKSLEAAQKRAEAAAKEAEKQRRQVEERLKKATAASEEAAERVQSIADELNEATTILAKAKRAVDQATRELEASFRESPK
jgi:type IV secretory pathway VirB10-like protein